MSGDLNVALRITSRDDGSKVVSNSLKEVAKNTEAVNKANAQADSTSKSWPQNSSKGAKVVSDSLKAVAKSTEEAARSTVKLGDEKKRANDTAVSGSRTLSEEYRRSASARETLGIRAERTIQREIQQTEAAYNRLARTGTMSAQEQARAYTAMKSKVGELRREMAGLSGDAKTGSSFLQSSMTVARLMMLSTAIVSCGSQPVATRLTRLATASISDSNRAPSRRSSAPASVNRAWRELRSNSKTSSASSIWRTRYVSALGTMLAARAAAAKLPVVPPQEMNAEHFLEHMAVDKKVLDGRLRLVLLTAIGKAVVSDIATADQIGAAIDAGCT